jgi:hypothetical protein
VDGLIVLTSDNLIELATMAVNVKVYFVGIVLGCLIYAWFLLYFKRDEVSKIGAIIKQVYYVTLQFGTMEVL